MEHIIAYHCAPALAGIKPANIVTCHKARFKDIHEHIDRLNCELNGNDIYFDILCECDKRVLVMAYRKALLRSVLQNSEVKAFLQSFGYPDSGNCDKYIDFLKSRISRDDFPHEIGVFLGYPLHDIYGFINHKNEGCLLCGEWKVYKNAEEAKKLFRRFANCRKATSKRISCGQTLAQIYSKRIDTRITVA